MTTIAQSTHSGKICMQSCRNSHVSGGLRIPLTCSEKTKEGHELLKLAFAASS